MRLIDDHIDFDAYLAGPDESASVRPASEWLEDVIQSFEQPATATGAMLPWAKTRELVRLRRGELSIWPGMSGHGKSMLIGQVALSLILRTNCRRSIGLPYRARPQEVKPPLRDGHG